MQVTVNFPPYLDEIKSFSSQFIGLAELGPVSSRVQ